MISKFFRVIGVLSVCMIAFPGCSTTTQRTTKLSYSADADWRRVAQSSLIIDGILGIPSLEIVSAERTGDHKHVTINATINHILKGASPSNSVAIEHYTNSGDNGISNEHLANFSKIPVIAFLLESEGKYYFINSGSDGLISSTQERQRELQSEVRRQNLILQNWSPNTSLPHYEKVQSLIRLIETNKLKSGAFRQLESLGTEAVPAMIAQMDNRTPIPNTTLALKNLSGDAFEDYRQYRPEAVVDAIAAILNQITGEGFGYIYNGGSETDRRHTVDAWRIYGMSHPAFQVSRPSISE